MFLFAPIETYGQRGEVIGEGSQGNVYATDKGYALKVSKNPNYGLPTHSNLSEIAALQKIRSRYVIPLVDVIFTPEETTLVFPLAEMNLVKGFTDLSLDPKRTVRDMCLGLAAVHNANLLHLDIKPANFLVFPGSIKIIDLGLSNMHTCALPPLRASNDTTYYTLPYRPLEVTFEAPITEKSDIWALGVVLAEYFIYKAGGKLELLFPALGEKGHILEVVTLLGSPPEGLFRGKEAQQYVAMNISSEGAYDYFLDRGLSEEEVGLVLPMLDMNPEKRPTIFEVLESEYFQENPLGSISRVWGSPIPNEWTCFEKLQVDEIEYPEDVWDTPQERSLYIRMMIQEADNFLLLDSTLALGVYLFDAAIANLRPQRELFIVYALACLAIANMFYISNYDFTSSIVAAIISDERRRVIYRDEVRSIMVDILMSISFDLSPVTAYIYLSRVFLEEPRIRREATNIWKQVLSTEDNYWDQLELADAILLRASEEVYN